MSKYKTKSKIDFTKTVVISFDLKVEKNNYEIGVGYDGGEVLFRGQNQIKSIHLPQLVSNKNNVKEFSILSNNKIVDELITAEIDFNNSFISKNTPIIKNKNGELCVDDESKTVIEDNKIIYKKIDESSSEDVENLIVIDDIIYKIANDYDCTSYCLCSDKSKENNKEEFILKIQDDGFDLELLNVDITASRNLSTHPIYQILQQISSINPETSQKTHSSISEIKNGVIFEGDQNRIRFVFTNGGRLLNVSQYIKDKKIYENIGSFSFTQNLNESYLYVYTSSSSVSNVSTNF